MRTQASCIADNPASILILCGIILTVAGMIFYPALLVFGIILLLTGIVLHVCWLQGRTRRRF